MAHFNEYVDIAGLSVLVEHCLQQGKKRIYKKGEYFNRTGEVCRAFGYIVQGSFRHSYMDADSNRHVIGYNFEKSFVSDYNSLTGQLPAAVCSEAIRESIVYEISFNELEAFWKQSDEYQALGRKLAEGLFRMAYNRILNQYVSSPKTRYLELLKRCPNIIQLTSLKEIASFLNISPYTLSRIRKEVTFGVTNHGDGEPGTE